MRLAKTQRKKLFEFEGRYDDIEEEMTAHQMLMGMGGGNHSKSPKNQKGKAAGKASLLAQQKEQEEQDEIQNAIKLRKMK